MHARTLALALARRTCGPVRPLALSASGIGRAYYIIKIMIGPPGSVQVSGLCVCWPGQPLLLAALELLLQNVLDRRVCT